MFTQSIFNRNSLWLFQIAFSALLKSGVEISLLGLRMQFCITQEVSWDKMILSISTARKRRGYYTLKRRNSDQWWKSEEIFQGQLGPNVEHIFPQGAYSWPGWFFTVQHDSGIHSRQWGSFFTCTIRTILGLQRQSCTLTLTVPERCEIKKRFSRLAIIMLWRTKP